MTTGGSSGPAVNITERRATHRCENEPSVTSARDGTKSHSLEVRRAVLLLARYRPAEMSRVRHLEDAPEASGDRQKKIPEERVLLRVVANEAGRLREASEVIGAHVVLVDLRLGGT